LLLALTTAAIVPGLIQRNGTVQFPEGVRPDRDGRLLGHFPYRELPRSELIAVAPGLELQRDAARALMAMQEAARAEGVALVALSGFRSMELQKRLFFEVKSARNQSALERARVSAPPGYSEHSTGYAVDLADASAPSSDLSADFDQTAAFAWLQNHARRFHFTLSFPQGNAQGVNYEPWHWRYEGSAQALRTFEPAQRLNR
jgi:D-alanyl-D-alanine carboxypeptidase